MMKVLRIHRNGRDYYTYVHQKTVIAYLIGVMFGDTNPPVLLDRHLTTRQEIGDAYANGLVLN